MRIETTGNKKWRINLYEQTGKKLEESTKSGAIDSACMHTSEDIENKEKLLKWAESNLTVEETQELFELLSTDQVKLSIEADHTLSTV